MDKQAIELFTRMWQVELEAKKNEIALSQIVARAKQANKDEDQIKFLETIHSNWERKAVGHLSEIQELAKTGYFPKNAHLICRDEIGQHWDHVERNWREFFK
jgi:hypothetical protein